MRGNSSLLHLRFPKLSSHDRFSAFVNSVVGLFRLDASKSQPGRMAPPTASLNFGSAGVAYALNRISCAISESSLVVLADFWADRSIGLINEPDAFYREDLDVTEETMAPTSLYHTGSGVYAVRASVD